ncbi:MAG: hypothetical protein SF097_25390 [Acidobacteriota bacterium]|nr:hypothetical protein [Acidobacteriota bacterium]
MFNIKFDLVTFLRVHLMRAILLAVSISVASHVAAQEPTRQSLEEKKQRLATLETKLIESKKRSDEIEAQLKALSELQEQLKTLKESIVEMTSETSDLREDIPDEEEYLSFIESPPRTILDVADIDAYWLDFSGVKKLVKLHGISIDPLSRVPVTKQFKKQVVKKTVYVRCVNADCSQAYIYGEKRGASLNIGLVQAGVARATGDARYDVAASLNTNSQSGSLATGSSRSIPGTDVHVSGYYRKDGKYVRPHTRSAPGGKSGGGSSKSTRSSGSRRR